LIFGHSDDTANNSQAIYVVYCEALLRCIKHSDDSCS